MIDHEQLLSDQAESEQWEREQLAKQLGREPTDEEFEDAHEAWMNAEMEAARPEYDRIKRWADPEPDEMTERDNPKLLWRRLAGLS